MSDVLSYVEYDPKELINKFRTFAEQAVAEENISVRTPESLGSVPFRIEWIHLLRTVGNGLVFCFNRERLSRAGAFSFVADQETGGSSGGFVSSMTLAGVRAQKRVAVCGEMPFMFKYRVRSREEERCPISICNRL